MHSLSISPSLSPGHLGGKAVSGVSAPALRQLQPCCHDSHMGSGTQSKTRCHTTRSGPEPPLHWGMGRGGGRHWHWLAADGQQPAANGRQLLIRSIPQPPAVHLLPVPFGRDLGAPLPLHCFCYGETKFPLHVSGKWRQSSARLVTSSTCSWSLDRVWWPIVKVRRIAFQHSTTMQFCTSNQVFFW